MKQTKPIHEQEMDPQRQLLLPISCVFSRNGLCRAHITLEIFKLRFFKMSAYFSKGFYGQQQILIVMTDNMRYFVNILKIKFLFLNQNTLQRGFYERKNERFRYIAGYSERA